MLVTYNCAMHIEHSRTPQYSFVLNPLSLGTSMYQFYIKDISITCGLTPQVDVQHLIEQNQIIHKIVEKRNDSRHLDTKQKLGDR